MNLAKILGGLRVLPGALTPILDPSPEKGDTGDTGSSGAAGATGAAGSSGPPGATGAAGPKGDTGDTGPTGAAGSAGATGAAGAKGDKGDTGNTGSAGATGSPGATGATGATGAAGGSGTALPNITVGETASIALLAGIRKVVVACAGALVGDRIAVFPMTYQINGGASTPGTPPGYAIADACVTTAGNVTVTITIPAIVLLGNYSIVCKVVAFR